MLIATMERLVKIGELARVTGTNAKTIRFYEAEGFFMRPKV